MNIWVGRSSQAIGLADCTFPCQQSGMGTFLQMLFKVLIVPVHAVFSRVLLHKRLHGGNNDTGIAAYVVGSDDKLFIKVENPHLSSKLAVNDLAVGMAAISQGFGGLPSYRIRWHKSQDKGMFFFAQGFAHDSNRMGGNDSFSAASGDFEAYARCIGNRIPSGIGAFKTCDLGSDFRV
jgi:hypothetical protein